MEVGRGKGGRSNTVDVGIEGCDGVVVGEFAVGRDDEVGL